MLKKIKRIRRAVGDEARKFEKIPTASQPQQQKMGTRNQFLDKYVTEQIKSPELADAAKTGGGAFTMDEMMPLKTLTSKGSGELKQMAKGGRAGLKGGGICKRGMNPKARGKNS